MKTSRPLFSARSLAPLLVVCALPACLSEEEAAQEMAMAAGPALVPAQAETEAMMIPALAASGPAHEAPGGGGANESRASGAAGGGIPNGPARYQIRITGTTYQGNTNFPTNQTQYTPIENFDLSPGVLIVEPTLDRYAASGNGLNARDVGIFVGDPRVSPRAGSLYFATNAGMFTAVGAPPNWRTAAQDIAYVTTDAARATMQISLDTRYTPAIPYGVMNTQTSYITGPMYRIFASNVQLTFTRDGRVSGTLVLIGNGFPSPSAVALSARLSGFAIR